MSLDMAYTNPTSPAGSELSVRLDAVSSGGGVLDAADLGDNIVRLQADLNDMSKFRPSWSDNVPKNSNVNMTSEAATPISSLSRFPTRPDLVIPEQSESGGELFP